MTAPLAIAVIGATGSVGAPILAEGLERGHAVTAIARDPTGVPTCDRATARRGDATDVDALAALVAGHDVVVGAFDPGKDAGGTGPGAIVEATRRAGVARLLVVGGAGSSEVAPGRRLVDQPEFPAEWRDGALATAAVLDMLRGERDLDWGFVSPAAMLASGPRTGRYRTGGDRLLTDAAGESRISLQDDAVAMLDEAERPRHHRPRFSYELRLIPSG